MRAKKSLGQNFLTSSESLDAIASAVTVAGENILEVGPGYGALTERLLSLSPASLTLVELDSDMVFILKDRIATGDLKVPSGVDFQIVQEDVLKFVPRFSEARAAGGLGEVEVSRAETSVSTAPYKVIANIPYYITSPILYRFFYDLPERPESMVILMQKEVADRIRAKDGKHTYLSLFCAYACESIEEIAKVPASCFSPAPKVDSAVLRFVCKKEKSVCSARDDAMKFLKIARAGFSAPRKKLVSNLAGGLGLSKGEVASALAEIGLREDVRPEAVGLEDWKRIVQSIG